MMMIRKLGALALASGILLGSASANAAWRWPWEKPAKPSAPATKNVPTLPVPATRPQPNAPTAIAPTTLSRLYDVYRQEVANAQLALSRTKDAQVKAFATQAIRRADYALQAIQSKASKDGVALSARQNVAGFDFASLNGAAFDAAYLTRSMQDLDSVRPEFATYKENESDHAFHAQLSDMWNDLVAQRDQAKSLHDQIRNDHRAEVDGR